MADAIKGNAIIGQSGGPTAVINQSLVGAIEALYECDAVENVLGAQNAVRGIVEERFLDLNGLDAETLEAVANTPAAALGSSRDKPDAEYCKRIFQSLEKRNIRYFFYIGGNDSAATTRIVNEMANEAGYEMRVFHIPKTIDNDLRVTDHCPGYGSAAKFVASAFMGDDRDNNALPGIKINVVMGRNAGWLTAASVLGRGDVDCGPHLVYVPEVAFDTDKFIADVREVYGRLGRCQIAVSEGIADETGMPVTVGLAERLGHRVERDSHGNVQLSGSGALGDFLGDLVKQELKQQYKTIRVRSDTFGYLQRSFAGFASEVDQKEARLAGRTAVQYATSGDIDGSVAFNRIGEGENYAVECFRAELKDVARETKDLPREWINEAGNGIQQAFIDYAMPLTGGLPKVGQLRKMA